MPREAKLFTSSAGSVVRGYLKFRANISPRWIKNARGSRKRIEPEIAEGFRSLKHLRIRRPIGESRNSERAAGIALGLGSLGDSLPQGELLSGDTNPLGVAAGWLKWFVKMDIDWRSQMQGAQLRYAIKFVSDIDKAVKFHRDVLGLKVKFESPGWSEFVTGETTLALHQASEKNPAGKVELGFTVPDVEVFTGT